jgi:hypothetical protein
MIRLCHVVPCLLLTLSLFAPLSSAHAQQAFQRFLPLFVELDGWQGKKADGMSMQMSDTSMTTANRDYTRGSARANASVVLGQTAAAALAPMQNSMNIQTSEGHMVTATMHGMPVLKSFTTAQKSGTLMVALGKDAIFTLSYNGLTEDEALALAEKFDWKAMQAAAQSK